MRPITTTKARPKSKPQIHVRWFEGNLRTGYTITAFCENTSKFSQEPYAEIDIDVEEFKAYAQKEEAFNWCMDYNDPSKVDGHGQITGTMTWDEYCDLPEEAICNDLAKFLQHKAIEQ